MSGYHCPDAKTLQSLKDIANQLRIHSVQMTNASGSGHPTSCASIAEIMSVLFFHTMKIDPSFPRDPASDRFILSKGHAAPILYAAWAETGLFPTSDLLNLRKLDSDLEGHPTPKLNFIDVATGSLGQGLSVGAGMAYIGKYMDKASFRVYCVIGDGESAEGSIWEAMSFASFYKLDNLVAIFDVNRLGQSEEAPLQHDTEVYKKRAEAFGWNTVVVDGHSVEDLCKAFHMASQTQGKPTCIVAKTFKGQGFANEICDHLNWHGKALGGKADESLELVKNNMVTHGPWKLPNSVPKDVKPITISNIKLSEPPSYKLGEKVAVRLAYGTALAKLGRSNDRVVAMDGDTKNSTYSITFKKEFPDRYIECFIAEQNLVGVAIGCATRDRTVAFCSTFAAFFTRAFDQIRMGAISQTNVNFAGSHAGISIGEDGPSQMALEDLAMFRSVPNSTVFYPSDAVSAERAVELAANLKGEDGPSQMALEDLAMFRSVPNSTVFYPSDAVSAERAVELAANLKGVCFIRTSRPNVPVIYPNDEVFEPGKAKIVRQSKDDVVTVIGCCVTLVEALTAADELAKNGINIRVVDPFTLKPFDKDLVLKCAKETGGKIVTVEDHYLWGGLGDVVSGCLSEEQDITIKKLAVTEIPRSGPPAALLAKYGIDSKAIVSAVMSLIEQKSK